MGRPLRIARVGGLRGPHRRPGPVERVWATRWSTMFVTCFLDRAARLNLAQGLSVIEGLRHEIGIVGNEEIHLPAEGFLSRRQLYAAAPELAPIPVDHEVDGFRRERLRP